ncbi:MAG: ABC transporter permease [Candidatus Humimicrobiaceae bacterium]
MASFNAYFKKEVMESVRTYKYLIIAAGFIFWALMDPLMLKILPIFLKTTIPPEMLSQLTDINRDAAFQNLLKDIFQISTLFVSFSLMGVLSAEVTGKKLLFPYSRGVRFEGMVIAKYVNYTAAISIFIFIAFLTNYLYISLLFKDGTLTLGSVLQSAFLFIFYYAFVMALLLFLSSLFKKSILAGIIVLVLTYVSSIFNQFVQVRPYLPNYLLFKAADNVVLDTSLLPTYFITSALIILLVYFSIIRMKRIDVV